MKISASDSALLSARERAMLQSSGPWHVRDLVSLIKRLRDLRDKQRQLNQRQVAASARSAKGKSAAVNARTVKKGKVLDKALKHFEAELDSINKDSSAATAALKAAGKPAKKTAAKNASGRKAGAKKSAVKKPAARKSAAKKKPAAKKPGAKKSAVKKFTPAKPARASKAGAKKGPKRTISDKARIKLPTGGRGDAPSQVASLPSRNMKGRRSR